MNLNRTKYGPPTRFNSDSRLPTLELKSENLFSSGIIIVLLKEFEEINTTFSDTTITSNRDLLFCASIASFHPKSNIKISP